MSEEIKAVRLSKITKEFNIGVATVVEFLAKKGYEIDSNPNTKIDGKLYQLLASEFQREREVKEQADKISLVAPQTVVEAKETEQPETSQEVKKTTAVSSTKKKSSVPKKKEEPKEETIEEKTEEQKAEPQQEPVKASEQKEEPTPEKTEPESDEVVQEQSVVLKEEAQPDIADHPLSTHEQELIVQKQGVAESKETYTEKTETVEERVDVYSEQVQEEKPEADEEPSQQLSQSEPQADVKEVAGIKVVGKIAIDRLNTKVRPKKKTKAEKAKEKEAAKAEANKEVEQEVVAKEQPEETLSETPESLLEETTLEQPQENIQEEQKEDNFIETKYIKLEGPKIVEGKKVDLSQFEKTKKSSAIKDEAKEDKHRKKRKRIGKGGVDVGAKQTTSSPSFKDKKENAKAKKPKKGKAAPQPEIDEQEIEKQIKETLARLAPTGKSKTSKHRREKRQLVSQHMQDELDQSLEEKKNIRITEFVTANELATMMEVSVNKVISACMSLGMLVSINQRLDAEAIQIIADEFGYNIEFVSADVVEALEEDMEEDTLEDMQTRAPIVTVMGHVDHGKTSLLDYIRNANVIAGEAGGITQHVGAYEVKLPGGKRITFLDTPGHEAFTAMRARGAKVTDVAIVVVACDDRVMPQTVEAINHAQAAGCPIIFALNKIDKPTANPDKIREELANMNILVEEWGGKHQSQEISAKQGLNVELLLEKVLLEAELLELKANPNKRASGTIIESSLDKGRGYVAKILVQEGTLRMGDFVLAGTTFGRVKAMYNERNQEIEEAGPSTPLLLLGLNGAPQAGDVFNVMPSEKEAKDIATRRTQLKREQGIRTQKHITLKEIGRRIAIGDFKQLNIIVKGDVDGSVEALTDSLLKLSTEQVEVNVIHRSVGQITESDVLLATASNAIIIGFQVRPSVGARKLAEAEQIDIRLYSIIYTAINEIKDAIEGMLSPEMEEKIMANLEVKDTFKISKVGTIAGCMCLDGKIGRNSNIRLIRDGIVIYTGHLASLKRFKDDVKEVVTGQECGLNIENFNDVKVGDIIEAYEEIEVKRK